MLRSLQPFLAALFLTSALTAGAAAQGLTDTVTDTVSSTVDTAKDTVDTVDETADEALGGLERLTGGQGENDPEDLTEVLDHNSALAAVHAARAMPLDRMLQMARVHISGQIIDVQLVEVGNFLLYEFKSLSDNGEIVNTYFYADSGRIVQTQQ